MGDVPSPRWRHTATLLPEDRGILVFGGLYKGKRYNDVHVFNVEKKEWILKECSGTPPHPRSHHTSSLVSFPAEPPAEGEDGDGKPKEDKLYVFGGYGGAGSARDFFSDIHVLDLLTWTWTKVRCAAGSAARRVLAPRRAASFLRRERLRHVQACRSSSITVALKLYRGRLENFSRACIPCQPPAFRLVTCAAIRRRPGRPWLVRWQGLHRPLR
eukprot:scaffold21051_cov111-Isochrysis_galbana.AAC.5